MKNTFVIIFAVLFILLESSCTKTEDQTISIVGKWQIINDTSSVQSGPTGLYYNLNYIGKPNDYYDFINDGNLYFKEGSQFLRGKYYMMASNQFQPVFFFDNGYSMGPYGAYGPLYTITNLTAHTATLTQSGITPDGPVWQMINLQK